MRLLEFQAKRILSAHGIPVPQGVLISKSDEAGRVGMPAVLKAQVPAGGRGKAGGISIVRDPEEAIARAGQILGATMRGYPVRALLAEELVRVGRELYLSVMVDGRAGLPLVMASAAGGIDIEEEARTNPHGVLSWHVDPFMGLQDEDVRRFVHHMAPLDAGELRRILERLLAMQRSLDAEIIEINPLGDSDDGLVAMDCKVVLDDKARFRHAELHAKLKEELELWAPRPRTPAEVLAAQYEITYIPLEGDIGVISDGAGTGMLTIDLIKDCGGEPADFCEMGGMSGATTMRQAMQVVLTNAEVKVLLVSLIGGLTRMDLMAEGIATYMEESGSKVPIVVRMCGTREELGMRVLRRVGIEPLDDLERSVVKAVSMARGD